MGCAASTEVAPAVPVGDEAAAANATTAAPGQVSTTDGTPVTQGGLLRVAKSADTASALPINANPAVAADSSIAKWNGISPAVIRAAAAHGPTAIGSCITKAGRVSQQEALTWAADLDAKSTNAWLAALQVGLDALWYPLITSAESALKHDGQGQGGARRPTWESLTAAEMLKLLRSTSECVRGQGSEQSSSWTYADSCMTLLALIDAIWQQRLLSSVDGSRVDDSPFVNANLQRVLSMLGIALCRTVAVEDVSTFSAKLHMWASVQRDFGLERPRLCAALDAPSKSLLLYADTVSVADSKLKLEVSRALALWDAWPQWRSSACCSLARGRSGSVKLYPRFRLLNGRLEAGEGHGPRKELFAMFGQQMLFGAAKDKLAGAESGAVAGIGAYVAATATTPLFPYRKEARVHWFDAAEKRSEERESMYHFAGWLIAQSVCNRSPLGVALPPLLFAKLLAGDGFKPTLRALETFDPSAAAGVRAIHKLTIEEFESLANAEVEEGQRPPTREEYEANALKQLLVDAVSWQFDALKTGFEAVFPPEALRPLSFSAEQLAVAVCGPADDDSDFDLRSTFRIIEDEEIAGCPALQSALWEVLDSWSTKDKRMVLQFVTGSERRPAAWTEAISIQMPFELDATDTTSATHMLGTLPQAHTCDNMLELPNYLAALCALRGVDYTFVKTQGGLTIEKQGKEEKNAKKGAATAAGLRDLLAELKRVIDERFRMAVSCCNQYDLDETADPAPPSDFPPFPLEKQPSKAAVSSLNLAPNARTPRGPTGIASATVAAPAQALPPSQPPQSSAPAEALSGKRPSRVPSASSRVPADIEGQHEEADAITSFKNSSRASTQNSRQGSARVSRQKNGRISSLVVADMDIDGDADDRQHGFNVVGGSGVDDGSWMLNKGPTVTRYVTARPAAAAAAPKPTSRPISREVKGIPSLDEDSFANTTTGDNIDSDTEVDKALGQSGERSRPSIDLDKAQDLGAGLHNLNTATHAPASADPLEVEEFE